MVIGEKKAKELYQKTEKGAIQIYESVSDRFIEKFWLIVNCSGLTMSHLKMNPPILLNE